MKKDLIKLIDSRKEIEKMFHPFGGGMGTSFERISDVPEFQNWLQEIKLEFMIELMTLLCGKLSISVASVWMVLRRKSILLSLSENFRLLEKILIDIIQTKKRVRIVTLTRRCFWYEKETAYIYKSFFQE